MHTRTDIARTTLIRYLGTRYSCWRLVISQTGLHQRTEIGIGICIPALNLLPPSPGMYCPDLNFLFISYCIAPSCLPELKVSNLRGGVMVSSGPVSILLTTASLYKVRAFVRRTNIKISRT